MNADNQEYMDLGWVAQTFAPDSYMVNVESIRIDNNSGNPSNIKKNTVTLELDNLVDTPWSPSANQKGSVEIFQPVDFRSTDSEAGLFLNRVSTSDIGYTFAHSTPCFNFTWRVNATYSTAPTDTVNVKVILLFYPSPYFDQRY